MIFKLISVSLFLVGMLSVQASDLYLLLLPHEIYFLIGEYLNDLESGKNFSETSKGSKDISDTFIDASLNQTAFRKVRGHLLQGSYDSVQVGLTEKGRLVYKKHYDNYFTKFARLYFPFAQFFPKDKTQIGILERKREESQSVDQIFY